MLYIPISVLNLAFSILSSSSISYSFFSHRNIVSTYGVSISDKENYPIGYIALDFMNGDKQDFETTRKCLNDKKIKIETLLSVN